MADPFTYDPNKLAEEQAAADSKKLWLNAFGGVADSLANVPSQADIMLKRTPQKFDAGAGFRAAAASVGDPAEAQKKRFELYKNAAEARSIRDQDGAQTANRDPESATSKAKKLMAQKYGLQIDPSMSGFDIDQLLDARKMNETEAKARVDFDNAKKLKGYEATLDLDKLKKEQELGLKGAPTDGQYNAGGFATRIADAENTLAELQKAGLTGAETESWLERNLMPNDFRDPKIQQLEQAQRDFITATLRKESGAAISPSEFETGKLQYFPQRGDSPEVVAQKARNRQNVLATMKAQAGPAFGKIAHQKSQLSGAPVIDMANRTISVDPQNTKAQAITPDVEAYAKKHNISPQEALKIKIQRGG